MRSRHGRAISPKKLICRYAQVWLHCQRVPEQTEAVIEVDVSSDSRLWFQVAPSLLTLG